MKMQDAAIGDLVFLDERIDDEVRETFYLRDGPTTCLHLGMVQGDPALKERTKDELGQPVLPRYRRFSSGYQYPLVAALPVKPINESRFWKYNPEQNVKGGKDG
jgi:hypothetical protein